MPEVDLVEESAEIYFRVVEIAEEMMVDDIEDARELRLALQEADEILAIKCNALLNPSWR